MFSRLTKLFAMTVLCASCAADDSGRAAAASDGLEGEFGGSGASDVCVVTADASTCPTAVENPWPPEPPPTREALCAPLEGPRPAVALRRHPDCETKRCGSDCDPCVGSTGECANEGAYACNLDLLCVDVAE